MTDPHADPDPDTILEVLRTSCAIRRYRTDPVPDEILRRCLEAATWAPSGSNLQNWRFCVLRAPPVRAVLGPAYRKGWAEAAASSGMDRIDPGDDSRRARAARAMEAFVADFERIPLYVLFCVTDPRREVGDAHASYESPDFMIGGSIFPAMQNFALAARAHGLGTVITSWFRHVEPELRHLVGIPDHWLLAGLMTLGYPRGRHAPVRRRPVHDVACVDHWDTMLEAG